MKFKNKERFHEMSGVSVMTYTYTHSFLSVYICKRYHVSLSCRVLNSLGNAMAEMT